MMALHLLEPVLPRQKVSPSAAIALPFAGNSDALDTEGRSVALGGFLTLGYLEGTLLRKGRFQEQALLRRFAP